MVHLYIKQHNVTGLKYFGKTSVQDPYTYKGSGKRWKRHLQKHGNDITTVMVKKFDNIQEASDWALKFSVENNIVNSKEWANMIEENAMDGGSLSEWHTPESRKKMSDAKKANPCPQNIAGWTHKEETKKKMSKAAKDRVKRDGPPKGMWVAGSHPNKGKKLGPRSEQHIKNLKESIKKQKVYTCEHCGKEAFGGNYARWHGDNCKHK